MFLFSVQVSNWVGKRVLFIFVDYYLLFSSKDFILLSSKVSFFFLSQKIDISQKKGLACKNRFTN